MLQLIALPIVWSVKGKFIVHLLFLNYLEKYVIISSIGYPEKRAVFHGKLRPFFPKWKRKLCNLKYSANTDLLFEYGGGKPLKNNKKTRTKCLRVYKFKAILKSSQNTIFTNRNHCMLGKIITNNFYLNIKISPYHCLLCIVNYILISILYYNLIF